MEVDHVEVAFFDGATGGEHALGEHRDVDTEPLAPMPTVRPTDQVIELDRSRSTVCLGKAIRIKRAMTRT
jgi:hypothetical protein